MRAVLPPAHFRAHERRPVRLVVSIDEGYASQGGRRQAVVVDLSIAGAGLETEDALLIGERISVTFATPSMWDPLVVPAVVAWAHGPRRAADVDALGRSRVVARAGVAFDYASPEPVVAMFEMLATLGYE